MTVQVLYHFDRVFTGCDAWCSWTLPDRVHKRILAVTGTKSVRFAPKYHLNRQVSCQITLNQVFTAACDPWWNTSSARFMVGRNGTVFSIQERDKDGKGQRGFACNNYGSCSYGIICITIMPGCENVIYRTLSELNESFILYTTSA